MAKELFGQFLIRRGRLKVQDIEEALMLQEILHDSMGAAALAEDLISFKDVGKILDYMDASGKSFPDAAVDTKILTAEKVEELKKSSGSRFRIGQLLVATTKLSQEELDEELSMFSVDRLLVPGPNVTKVDLVRKIASRTGFKSTAVKEVLESFLDTVTRELAEGKSVALKGFGSLTTKEYPARKWRNPRTGEPISIPVKRVARLRFAKKLIDFVNKSS